VCVRLFSRACRNQVFERKVLLLQPAPTVTVDDVDSI